MTPLMTTHDTSNDHCFWPPKTARFLVFIETRSLIEIEEHAVLLQCKRSHTVASDTTAGAVTVPGVVQRWSRWYPGYWVRGRRCRARVLWPPLRVPTTVSITVVNTTKPGCLVSLQWETLPNPAVWCPYGPLWWNHGSLSKSWKKWSKCLIFNKFHDF